MTRAASAASPSPDHPGHRGAHHDNGAVDHDGRTPTTTTTAPPPPGDGPSLIAVTPRNEPAGPPGGGLQVQGSGYTCPTVYFFFDRTRVGSGSIDAAGRVFRSGLSVPGDAGRSTHQVTASCDPSGDSIEKASFFEVLPVSVHRPAFVTSLPLPDQVSLDPGALMLSAAVAAGAIMLIAFPFELFNSSMEENYDEIRGWFGLGPRGVPEPKTHGRALSFFGLTAVAAVVWWIGLEICLAMIFLWGVVGLAVAMLPMRFLDGRKVFRWSRPAWAALFFLGIFATVHVLLRPGSGYVGETSEVSIGVMVLFVLFGAASTGLWAYFRFRPQRWVPVRA